MQTAIATAMRASKINPAKAMPTMAPVDSDDALLLAFDEGPEGPVAVGVGVVFVSKSPSRQRI